MKYISVLLFIMFIIGFLLVEVLLTHNASAQSKLECPLATKLFYISISINEVLGRTTFEIPNANCTDVLTEGKSGKALLVLDAKLVKTDWDLPQPLGPPNTGSNLHGGFAPLGSKFKINVEAKYILWDSGWKIDAFSYKGSQLVSMTSAPSPGGTQTLSGKVMANLTGAAEAPGPGDNNGSGTLQLTINPDKNEICYDLAVTKIDEATAAHIHEGAVGTEGPVKVPLDAPKSSSVKGCKTADAVVVKSIMANPANYYVNVHNAVHPRGAIRGQLSK